MLHHSLQLLNKEWNGSVGENFIGDFLIFGCLRYINQQTRFGKGIIQLNWIIGKKAIEAFKKRNLDYSYWNQQFKLKYGIRFLSKENAPLSEEFKTRERNRFQGEERLIHCLEFFLFNPLSKDCMTCKAKKECKQLYEKRNM
jgi:hypothetical protein